MDTLLQKQNNLHKEASMLLEQVLLPILNKYGSVSVGGSYLYKLLNHPDLDIDIVSDSTSKQLFAELSSELLALSYTSKFKSADRVNFPHAHTGKRPHGFWISPDINFGDNVWKLDIWLQKQEWNTGDTMRYEKELLDLDDNKRINILTLKENLIRENLYGVGKEFISVDVYDAVLKGNVTSIEDLRNFMSER